MKKSICLLACLLVALTGKGQAQSSGNWYHSNPDATKFTINTAAELAELATIVNDGLDNFSGNTILLGRTIDLTDLSGTTFPITDYEINGWLPIGTDLKPFDGTFDGQGYTIKGLWINRDIDCVGLFGYTQTSSRIMNLTVEIDNTGTDNPGIKKV